MTLAHIEQHDPLADKIAYAKALAASGLIPRHYQQQPANVLVAVEYGDALGVKPIVAMQQINVINGTPSLSAQLMASLARQAGHRVRTVSDSESATTTIVRADDPGFPHTATWDVAKAKAAGLWGKGHWAKDPATMLKWRSISEAVRFACPEVLGGISYTPDEVADFTPTHAAQAPATVAAQQVPVAPTSLADLIPDDDEPQDADVVDEDGVLL